MCRKGKIFAVIVAIVAAVSVAIIVCAHMSYKTFFHKQMFDLQSNINFVIEENTSFDGLIDVLKRNNLKTDECLLLATYNLFGHKRTIKQGHYSFNFDVSRVTFIRSLTNGWQKPVRLVVNNCRLSEQLAAKISSQMRVDSLTVIEFLLSPDSMKTIDCKPEQWSAIILSDTYEMWWTSSVSSIMQRFKTEFDNFWTEERIKQIQANNLTPFEAMTLASIVNEESNYEPEMPIIAGLYINRLRLGMPLQSDPTIKFALRKFDLNQILFAHLEYDSPYNTYKHVGLPPGPIRMPSRAALNAVINAQKHRYIYMCADEKLNGTHKFATTLSEHNQNAARYHKAFKEWKNSRK